MELRAKQVLWTDDKSIAYVWDGMFGKTLTSEEYVAIGTLRYIGGFTFYAWRSEKSTWRKKAETVWCLAEPHVSAERLREVRRSLFHD